MAIDRVPALKRCRSLGIEPGVIGLGKKSVREPRRTRGKVSEYGAQLKEKQKAKFIYGVLEKQFRAYYAKAKKMQGIAGDNLIGLLERRLDNVVYRLHFAVSRSQASQLVSHGHIFVNGKRLDIPSYLVKVGDVVEIKEKCKGSQRYKDILEVTGGRLVPEWIEADQEALKGTIKEYPTREMIDVPVNEVLIVELYSK